VQPRPDTTTCHFVTNPWLEGAYITSTAPDRSLAGTRLHSTILSIAAGLVFAVAGSASAQTWGRPRVPQSGACFYEHINFEGRYFCYRSGTSNDNVPRGLNNEISSVRIFGDAQVVVYKDGDFRGTSRHFESSVSDLRREGLNDRVSSLRVDALWPRRKWWGARTCRRTIVGSASNSKIRRVLLPGHQLRVNTSARLSGHGPKSRVAQTMRSPRFASSVTLK
jgi:hypothetical protein